VKHMNYLQAIIIEDNASMGMLYQRLLEQFGYKTHWVENGAEGVEATASIAPDLILLDLELPDMHGFEVLEQLKQMDTDFEIVVITGNTSIDAAVRSIQKGASDFIQKPFGKERLKTTLDNLMQKRELSQELQVLRKEFKRDGYEGFIGSSLQMQVVYRIIDSAAMSKASVFITGESGTGKELCAQAIHNRSDRASGPFIAVNCGAIPKDLFESEIFGHVKGAFSGAVADRAGAVERADGGTLFLDEIGEMSLDQQVKLLRMIQSSEVQRVGGDKPKSIDVRFVCATNRNPLALVRNKTFREDLYYRLNVIPIELPALCSRGNDVIQIARHMLRQFCEVENKNFSGFSQEVEAQFLQFDWPGNVRQLCNIVHNIVLLHEGDVVQTSMLPNPFGNVGPLAEAEGDESISHIDSTASSETTTSALIPLWITEKNAIEKAITQCNGNVPVAAAHLGVSASTIYRKKKQWESEKGELN